MFDIPDSSGLIETRCQLLEADGWEVLESVAYGWNLLRDACVEVNHGQYRVGGRCTLLCGQLERMCRWLT